MHIAKIFWGVRAVFYKLFMQKVSLPSYIGPPLFIEGMKNISIGKKVRIFPHVRIEAIENGRIIVENDSYIGQNCHITSKDFDLVIGSGTAVMANVCITNIDHSYEKNDTPVLSQVCKTKKTTIGKNCFIGHGAVLLAGTVLGDHCIVGANSVLRGKFPNNSVIVGAPAKIVRTYCSDKKTWINT